MSGLIEGSVHRASLTQWRTVIDGASHSTRDQAPLIEQTNEIVRRINNQIGRNVLVEAEALVPRIGRLPGIDGKAKMSKSQGYAILLSAEPEAIREARASDVHRP